MHGFHGYTEPVGAAFRQTTEDEIDRVRSLLRHSFHARADAPSLDPELLRWKYYQPGPAWPGSRSYVLSEADTFVAHAAIWPLQVRLQAGLRSGIGYCDWAARQEHRGVGLILLKHLLALAPFVLVIGGAPITRQILPRVGFKLWADLPAYARVLRPFRQVASRPSLNWKEPFRLARNSFWSLAPLSPVAGWTSEPALPDDAFLSLVHRQTGSVNDQSLLSFMLSCPGIPFRSLVLRKAGAMLGYAIVSIVGGQARIADLRMISENQADWNAAVATIVKELMKEKLACEAIALASFPLLKKALQANGFRVREHRPLVVFDRDGQIISEPVPPLGMLVDDASFNYFPESPYTT